MYETTDTREEVIWAEDTLVRSFLPKRKKDSHKGTYGKTAIVGGSADYTGAPYLSALASLRSGAGYTTLFVLPSLLPYYYLKSPELLLKKLNGRDRYAFKRKNMGALLSFDCIAYGMGMGVSNDVYKGVKYLLENYQGKLILDADGLNSLAKYGKFELKLLFSQKKCSVLVTPHVKEFSRLTSWSVEEILRAPFEYSEKFAREHKISVLLKGATTVVTDGNTTYASNTGNSGQAKAGSGDALSGLSAGLCAQGLELLKAGLVASYLLGKSAELLVKKQSEYTILPTDVIENLGQAFRLLLSENPS